MFSNEIWLHAAKKIVKEFFYVDPFLSSLPFCAGSPPVTDGLPAQMLSNAEFYGWLDWWNATP